MTLIENTLARITRAHKRLARLEAKLEEYESALKNLDSVMVAGKHKPVTIEDLAYFVGACADQEAQIDQLYLTLAIQKHGHDWDSIKAMAKDIKRHYNRRAQ